MQLLEKLAEIQLRQAQHSVLVRRWTTGEPQRLRVTSFKELQQEIAASPVLMPTRAATSSSSSSASSSLLYPFKLYYFPRGVVNWWSNRIKVDNDVSFDDYLSDYSSRALYQRPLLLVWSPPVDCVEPMHQTLIASDHQHSPLKDSLPPAPPLFPGDATVSVSSPSLHSGSSRSSTDQKPFAEAVYRRDGKLCVVCDAGQVEAAHIVPVKDERTSAGMEQAQLLTLYEPQNGLTLCTTCHDYFDAGLWYIQPTDGFTLVVSQALSSNDAAWANRLGQSVRRPAAFQHYWPPMRILSVQQTFYTVRQQLRADHRLDKPHACPSCLLRFAENKAAFKKHCRNCKARAMPSRFSTPAKVTSLPAASSGSPVAGAHKKKKK